MVVSARRQLLFVPVVLLLPLPSPPMTPCGLPFWANSPSTRSPFAVVSTAMLYNPPLFPTSFLCVMHRWSLSTSVCALALSMPSQEVMKISAPSQKQIAAPLPSPYHSCYTAICPRTALRWQKRTPPVSPPLSFKSHPLATPACGATLLPFPLPARRSLHGRTGKLTHQAPKLLHHPPTL